MKTIKHYFIWFEAFAVVAVSVLLFGAGFTVLLSDAPDGVGMAFLLGFLAISIFSWWLRAERVYANRLKRAGR